MTEVVIINNAQTLGTLLKSRRKELGITQMDLAKLCNLSHTGIGRIESTQNDVRLETLLKLSKVLGLTLCVELGD
jgi:transcriptional regulator with XRE-family HTH domain